MLFIPLPFVIAGLLFLLLARLIYERGTPRNAVYFYVLIGCYALSSTIIGLRWGYGFNGLLRYMSVLGASLPPLAWLAYKSLTASQPTIRGSSINLAPPAIVTILIFAWPDAIDVALILIYVIYATLMMNLAVQGPDALVRASLSHAVMAHRALIVTCTMLVMSLIVDSFIAFDFAKFGGIHASAYVSVASLLSVFILGAAAAAAGISQPADVIDEPGPSEPLQASPDDKNTFELIEKFVSEKFVFRDPDLTLNRLSRKMQIPARRISTAINRVRGESVSIYMNRHRIAEACRLLQETEQPITAIMFESGFQTKSNFNDSFRKITGTNPASWRENCNRAEKKT
jgi:AraC-like DNA-binding protein